MVFLLSRPLLILLLAVAVLQVAQLRLINHLSPDRLIRQSALAYHGYQHLISYLLIFKRAFHVEIDGNAGSISSYSVKEFTRIK